MSDFNMDRCILNLTQGGATKEQAIARCQAMERKATAKRQAKDDARHALRLRNTAEVEKAIMRGKSKRRKR